MHIILQWRFWQKTIEISSGARQRSNWGNVFNSVFITLPSLTRESDFNELSSQQIQSRKCEPGPGSFLAKNCESAHFKTAGGFMIPGTGLNMNVWFRHLILLDSFTFGVNKNWKQERLKLPEYYFYYEFINYMNVNRN